MDESQSSDFFSETDISYNNSMDSVPYETLITNTKLALKSRKEIKKPTFSAYFTSLVEDCQSCISQALDLIISILSDTDIQICKVIEYMSDAVSLLQMLSDFIKSMIESVSMACRNMKTFPTATCDIILKIFMHCKDSEYLYGPYISNVEKELKDLFRACHELQLTYLMIMEKHFVFDLTEKEEVKILTDALDINLKIGDIVQTLDVKTMAEQWKAFTAICEKYSNTLFDKNVYNNSLVILSEMIENNIKTALESDQEDKVILRSLKVASFSIKILLKICCIFKHATLKNYQGVFDLLLYVYSKNTAILEIDSESSSQLLNLMINNVCNPTDLLLKELLSDTKFGNHLLDYDKTKLQSEDIFIGYILIVMSMIKYTLRRDDNQYVPKHKLIIVIYGLFQHYHAHMYLGLKFPTEVNSNFNTQGLYENLLTHFVALATTLSAEDFPLLERSMMDSILGCDCEAALFSVNTWLLLARVITPNLLLNQLTSLCKIYLRLEKNKLFSHSPQKINLCYTIRCLFEVMQKEDKVKIFKLFNIHDEQYHNLWSSLKINNLPDNVQIEVENGVVERILQLRKNGANSGDVDKMIEELNLAATCSLRNLNDIVDCLLKAWDKACPKTNSAIQSDLCKETLWYLNYVSALVLITVENIHSFQSIHVIKILHIIDEIIKIGNTELKLVVINIVCKLTTLDVQDLNKHTVESVLINVLKSLSQDSKNVVKYKLYSSLRECRGDPNLHRLITIITKDPTKGVWDCFMRYGVLVTNKWREQLLLKYYKYSHKCIESNVNESNAGSLRKTCSGNFELVDIDALFENESDSEQPVHKKVKLNHNEADAIISRLENDVCLLCNLKDNIFTNEQKTKMSRLYDQLRNICE